MSLDRIIRDEMKQAGYDINNVNDVQEFWSRKGIGSFPSKGKIIVSRKLKKT